MTPAGNDLSNNNAPPVDWTGLSFSFVKASEAVGFIDATFGSWTRDAAAHGAAWGPYHFAHPDVNDPAAEAAHFLACAQRGQLGWALDIETRTAGGRTISPLAIMGPRALAGWCDAFYDAVAPELGAGYFYTFRSYATALLPLVSPAWMVWLSTMTGAPGITSWAGRTVDVEQWGAVGGVDANVGYHVGPPPAPAPEDEMGYGPGQTRDRQNHKWGFVVGDDLTLFASVDGGKFYPLPGKYTSALAAYLEPDGSISVMGRGLDGKLWQTVIYPESSQAAGHPPGSPPYNGPVTTDGHIYPPA